MPQEIEARWRLTSEVSRKLRETLFSHTHTYRELNVVMSRWIHVREGKALIEVLEEIRVRKIADVTGNWCTVELASKGPDTTKASLVRTREESQVTIHPAGDSLFRQLTSFFRSLGFSESFCYEKNVRQISYRTKRGNEVKVFLAELPRLGYRLEIEGPNAKVILGVAIALGLKDTDIEKESYRNIALTEHFTRELLFEGVRR